MPNSENVQAYLQDIDFHLEMQPNVTDKDKLYLLRTTSSPEVRSFLYRQPANTKTDYQRLQKALIKEFADPESDQGLVAALETRQGCHETPQAYYSCLRQVYSGTRNESDMEDELNFKTLFLRNLHPGTKSWDQARPHESHWERSWNQPSSFGNSREKNSWEVNGNSKGKRQTHTGAISPRNR